MIDNKWLEGLRAEYRYNLLCADLNRRIRDIRAEKEYWRAWRNRLIVAVVMVGSLAVGMVLAMWLR